MTSFAFPRTIAIKRPNQATATGFVGRQSVARTRETTLVTGISCNIHMRQSRPSSFGVVPGDAAGHVSWTITIIPPDSARVPLLEARDMVYDDLGRRFQIDACEPCGACVIIACIQVQI